MSQPTLNNYLSVALVIEGVGLFIWWVIGMYFASEYINFTKWAKYFFWVHIAITIITGISIILTHKA